MQATIPAPAIYLNADALDRILDEKLGRSASKGRRADFLKVNRVTLWRFRTGTKAGRDFIACVLEALPDVDPRELFYTRRDEQTDNDLQGVAA